MEENGNKSESENRGTKSFGKSARPISVAQGIEYTVLNNGTLTRQDIRNGLEKDLRGLFVFVSEILANGQTLEALTDTYYGRYQKLHEEREANHNETLTGQ